MARNFNNLRFLGSTPIISQNKNKNVLNQKQRGVYMSSNFPSYGGNTFPIESVNQFTLNALNPYSLYHYTVTIISPIFPQGESPKIEVPTITVSDFKFWCGSFFDVDDPDNTLYPLANALIGIAKQYIDIELFGDEDNYSAYKRVVSLYVGHYLELHLEMLKDERNRHNMTPENQNIKIEIEIPSGSKTDFMRTSCGSMLWSLYGGIVKWAFQRETPTWGVL